MKPPYVPPRVVELVPRGDDSSFDESWGLPRADLMQIIVELEDMNLSLYSELCELKEAIRSASHQGL